MFGEAWHSEAPHVPNLINGIQILRQCTTPLPDTGDERAPLTDPGEVKQYGTEGKETGNVCNLTN